MKVRTIAWLNSLGLVAFVSFAFVATRAPVASLGFALRTAVVLAVGFSIIGGLVLLSRRTPVAAKIALAMPLVVAVSFVVGLLVAALVAPL